jgi:hypothetical protein
LYPRSQQDRAVAFVAVAEQGFPFRLGALTTVNSRH